jgi:hypothetical protein
MIGTEKKKRKKGKEERNKQGRERKRAQRGKVARKVLRLFSGGSSVVIQYPACAGSLGPTLIPD